MNKELLTKLRHKKCRSRVMGPVRNIETLAKCVRMRLRKLDK